jgi:hypothetical protein
LDRPGPRNHPEVREDHAVKLTSYPGTVRQLIVTGLGREEPTAIITNDGKVKPRALVTQDPRRMTEDQAADAFAALASRLPAELAAAAARAAEDAGKAVCERAVQHAARIRELLARTTDDCHAR